MSKVRIKAFMSLESSILKGNKKVRIAEYNNVRSQLDAINRKQTGSLAVCDLSNLVAPEDLVTSEHLVTLIAVVPKFSQKDWLSSYETLTTYVVPRSSKNLHEDNEYAIYTVTLFVRDADSFRTKARERGFQVFTSWMHFCAVRLFAESILGYGLPPSFLSVVLSPSVKSEKKVGSILETLCSSSNRG